MNNTYTFADEEVAMIYATELNEDAKRVFDWVCYTLNCAGYVPLIFRGTDTEISFFMRKIKGARLTFRYHDYQKLVFWTNFLFKVQQKHWPLKLVEDIMGGSRVEYMTLSVTNELTPNVHENEEMVGLPHDIFLDQVS